jgi:hypothetical protein
VYITHFDTATTVP